MRHLLAIVALFVVLCGPTTIVTAAALEQRVALVIGNSDYTNAPLTNPVNDARLMSGTLRGLGFDVIERTNATQREMKLAIFELGDRLEAAGKDAVGLFYYAGHGVQVGGQNYLIPLNAEIESERHVAIEAVGASWVLSQMEFAGNRMNFVILDACRNNPLTRGFRSSVRGLAKMNAPTGSLVAYSTGPGDVAADGEADNSPYTLALAEAMQRPGLAAEKVFKIVRDAVREKTNDAQTPWEESSMTGADFYFNAAVVAAVEAPTAAPTAESSVIRADTSAMELAFWQSIQNSTDPAMFEAYLQNYPNGSFAIIARLKRDASSGAPVEETQVAAVIPPPEASIVIEELDATYVAVRTSNVRSEPTTGSDRIGQLARDDAVTVTGKVADKDWYRIAYQGGTAYVFGNLIEEIDPGEIVAWETIASTSEVADLELFLDDFPDGYFAPRARSRMTAVENAERKEAERRAAEEAQRKAAERRVAEEARRVEAERKAAEEAQRTAAAREAQERALWDTIKNSASAANYQAYLQLYPNGTYAALAKARMAEAERKAVDEAARKEAEPEVQQETQTALLVPPKAEFTPSEDQLLKDQNLKSAIPEYFDKKRIRLDFASYKLKTRGDGFHCQYGYIGNDRRLYRN